MSDYENDGNGFDVWTYVARLGCRVRSSTDPFFADGDAVCQMRTCQYLIQEDEEELLHTDYEEFSCQVPGCKATFNQLIDSEFHYATKHTFACSVCQKSLPSSHLLGLHIAENHDSFFEVLSQKKPSYECLLETCANADHGGPKFWTAEERKKHCMEVHKFSSNFKFDDYKKVGNKNTSEKKKSKLKNMANSKQKISIQPSSRNKSPRGNVHDTMDTDDIAQVKLRPEKLNTAQTTTKQSVVYKKVSEVSNDGIKFKYMQQKSHDPSSSRRYSSATYSKQISLDESNKNDNLATSTKRSPVSLAMMGERLSNKVSSGSANNRHSVCFGAAFSIDKAAEHVSAHRRSLSPKSDAPIRSHIADICDKEPLIAQSGQKGIFDSSRQMNLDQKIFASPTSPEKSRRNSRSSIPVFIGRGTSRNQAPESPKQTKARHSVTHITTNESNTAAKSEQNFRSRRSTFPRNSFSSMTSNSSSASVTTDIHFEDKSSRRYIESLHSKSPSHKRYPSYRKDSEERVTHSSLDNIKGDPNRSNNNSENKNNNASMQVVPGSPSGKSRIPVLRSSSCRSVLPSSQITSTTKNIVPKTISFGHGIARTFKMSQPNYKGGQHWYQLLNNRPSNGNKFRSYSVEKYAGQNAMDTDSVIDKCNFEDMRMALN